MHLDQHRSRYEPALSGRPIQQPLISIQAHVDHGRAAAQLALTIKRVVCGAVKRCRLGGIGPGHRPG